MRDHPYSTIGLKDIYSLFSAAYLKASSMEIVINGFRKTGIHPFNPEVFSLEDFATLLPLQPGARFGENEQGITHFLLKIMADLIIFIYCKYSSPSNVEQIIPIASHSTVK